VLSTWPCRWMQWCQDSVRAGKRLVGRNRVRRPAHIDKSPYGWRVGCVCVWHAVCLFVLFCFGGRGLVQPPNLATLVVINCGHLWFNFRGEKYSKKQPSLIIKTKPNIAIVQRVHGCPRGMGHLRAIAILWWLIYILLSIHGRHANDVMPMTSCQ
jgi:hypothetical protein